MTRRFKQVDVFTSRPLMGNPVAVVLDADDLDTARMQAFAHWTNLSETAFVLPPERGGDYRLRIFTPRSELAFAGHPTLGAAHAVLEAGVLHPERTEFVQECPAGALPLRVEPVGPERLLFVDAPPRSFRPIDDHHLDEICTALDIPEVFGVRPMVVTLGPAWLVIDLGDAEAVASLTPRMSPLASASNAMRITGVTVFGRARSSTDAMLRVRSFAPAEGIAEDPVCGSGNVAVAAFLQETGLFDDVGTAYIASQGREVGRDGRVHVRIDPRAGRIQVGGAALTCIDGVVRDA
jgi:PhzF family phenazine biosynthesis protein